MVKEMWPPASPDLNPVDFLMSSIANATVVSVAQIGVDALKNSLLKEWTKII